MVRGNLFLDTNEDGEMGEFDERISNMKLVIMDQRSGTERIIFSDAEGGFEVDLVPGGYSIEGYKYQDNDPAGQPYGQTQQCNHGMQTVSPEQSDCIFDIVPEHLCTEL